VKGTLGWSAYQGRKDEAIRRYWALVCCAFSFCWWANGHDRLAAVPPLAVAVARPSAPAAATNAQAEMPPVLGENQSAGRPPRSSGRPQIAWPVALRQVRAWLEPWIMLGRYWRGWTVLPPPQPLQTLLDWVGSGHPIQLYDTS
jgi:hypothetical protein